MTFQNFLFPVDYSYGSAGGPGFKTHIIELPGGGQETLQRWATPLRTWDVAESIKTIDDLVIIMDFFIARDGAANSWRFKDPFDFSTNADHRGAVDDEDVLLGVGDGSQQIFDLKKFYGSSPTIKTRNILLPVVGTVVIADDGAAQTEGLDFSVDYFLGKIDFGGGASPKTPLVGNNITGGFQFDIAARFTEETDRAMQMSYESFESGSLQILIREVKAGEFTMAFDPDEEFFYGGARDLNPMIGNFLVNSTDGRVISFTPDASGHQIRLPSTTNLTAGGPYWYFFNDDGTNTIDIKKDDGSNLDQGAVQIPTNGSAVVVLGFVSSTLSWRAIV